MKTLSRKMMKASFSIAIISISFYACKKGDTGPAGPQGPQGNAGATGATGAQGAQGNANVKVYRWNTKITSTSTNASVDYSVNDLRTTQVTDSSAWFVYIANDTVTNSPNWYPLPGTFSNGADYFRTFSDFTQNFRFRVIRVPNLSASPTATGPWIFKQTRLVVIPASSITNGRLSGIDMNDYNAVVKAFNIKEEDVIKME
jgi:hypothetical protein